MQLVGKLKSFGIYVEKSFYIFSSILHKLPIIAGLLALLFFSSFFFFGGGVESTLPQITTQGQQKDKND
jgi:hypothetical protein